MSLPWSSKTWGTSIDFKTNRFLSRFVQTDVNQNPETKKPRHTGAELVAMMSVVALVVACAVCIGKPFLDYAEDRLMPVTHYLGAAAVLCLPPILVLALAGVRMTRKR